MSKYDSDFKDIVTKYDSILDKIRNSPSSESKKLLDTFKKQCTSDDITNKFIQYINNWKQCNYVME